jgi:hypothetical protein
MILRPLSSINNVCDFTIKLVEIIIRNNKTISVKELKECFRKYLYSHPDKEFIIYYITCLQLMTINLSDQNMLFIDENNNIIII